MKQSQAERGQSQLIVWAGRIISGLVIAFLLADAATELFAPEMVRHEFEQSGFRFEDANRLGLIVMLCAIAYAIPRTAVLGAILVTGFFGGAICAHFRLGELGSPPQLLALLVGIAAWGGLYLRDPRLRALLPVRLSEPSSSAGNAPRKAAVVA